MLDRVDTRGLGSTKARLKALKEAWQGEGFRCYYTGVKLVEDDASSPTYLTFDHRTPRDKEDVVVAAALVNYIKVDMAEHEFKAVVAQLAKRFAGDAFDEAVLNLEHWKRERRPAE